MVFTGIVEEMGAVSSALLRTLHLHLRRRSRRESQVVSMALESDLLLWDGSRGSGWILKVRMDKGLVDAYEGASIAINGVCLTVLEWPVKDGVVSFGVSPETIKLTNLVRLTTTVTRSQLHAEPLFWIEPWCLGDCMCRAT